MPQMITTPVGGSLTSRPPHLDSITTSSANNYSYSSNTNSSPTTSASQPNIDGYGYSLPSMRTAQPPYPYGTTPSTYAGNNPLLPAASAPLAPPPLAGYMYADANRYSELRPRPDAYYGNQYPTSSTQANLSVQAPVPVGLQQSRSAPLHAASLSNHIPEPTRMVGQQGRRGILPSAPGRPPPTSSKKFVPVKDDDGKWPCPNCNKAYLHAKHLKRHMLRHTGDRPYRCILCSDTFSRSDILKRHWLKCSIRRGAPPGADHLDGTRGRNRGGSRGGIRVRGRKTSRASTSSGSTGAEVSASTDTPAPGQTRQDIMAINSSLAATQIYDQPPTLEGLWDQTPTYAQPPSTTYTPTGTPSARTSRSNSLMHHPGAMAQNGASFTGMESLSNTTRTSLEEAHGYGTATALPNGISGTYPSGVYANGFGNLTQNPIGYPPVGFTPPTSVATDSNGMYQRYGTTNTGATNPQWAYPSTPAENPEIKYYPTTNGQ